MSSPFAQQRRILLESLATALARRGLLSTMIGGEDAMLLVRHPRTGRQTIVFAIPASTGWRFLWAPDGNENADHPGPVADLLVKLLARTG